MPNKNVKMAEAVSAAELRAIAEQLDAYLHTIRRAEAEAIRQPNQTLYSYSFASGKAGMERLRSFVQQIDTSRYKASIGQPVRKSELRNKRAQSKDD